MSLAAPVMGNTNPPNNQRIARLQPVEIKPMPNTKRQGFRPNIIGGDSGGVGRRRSGSGIETDGRQGRGGRWKKVEIGCGEGTAVGVKEKRNGMAGGCGRDEEGGGESHGKCASGALIVWLCVYCWLVVVGAAQPRCGLRCVGTKTKHETCRRGLVYYIAFFYSKYTFKFSVFLSFAFG